MLSCDGGQSKLIITMVIYDMDNLSDDGKEFRSGGRRAMMIVARGDYAPELMRNWRIIFDRLRLFEDFWMPFYLSGDLKAMNMFSGRSI